MMPLVGVSPYMCLTNAHVIPTSRMDYCCVLVCDSGCVIRGETEASQTNDRL